MTIQKEKILITGSSGLVGSNLTKILLNRGFEVRTLGRKKITLGKVKSFVWDYQSNYIEKESVLDIDYIIHLAGAGVMDQFWTKKRKKEIVESRVNTTNLLYQTIKENNIQPKAFISASGINYYGTRICDTIFNESHPPGKDFLARCVVDWEKSADQFSTLCRVVKFRFGMILTKNGGALSAITKPIKLGFGASLGTGKQFIPWIHIDDVCHLILHGITSSISGSYNSISPNHITNQKFTKLAATVLNRKILLPNAPSFILKLILGERATLVLNGSRANSQKIESTGYKFKFDDLERALLDLLPKNP